MIQNLRFKQLRSVILSGLFLFGTGILSFLVTPLVSADTPPLDPTGCFVREAAQYNLTDCPSTITPSANQCILINTSARGTTYFDLNCQNANQGAQINPSTGADVVTPPNLSNPTSNIGTQSGEGEEARELNACAEGDEECVRQKCESTDGAELSAENCGIVAYLVLGINVLSALAGMAIIGSMMLAGFQYMTAKDNSGQVEAARKRITWAVIALAIFIFMYSVLNWVVPGGVL